MPGPATYARDADVAASARVDLDAVAEAAQVLEEAQRSVLARLIGLWPTSAWLAAGAKSARAWLRSSTGLAPQECRRLERIAQVCAAHPSLGDAVTGGRFRLGWAESLARAVTAERAPFLADALHAFLGLATSSASDDDFDTALRYWTARVDEHLAPRTVPKHSVVLSRRLFGGGQAQVDLHAAAFETFVSALDAWTQGPDANDAPHIRTLAERRADGIDDMSNFALTHDPDRDTDTDTDTDSPQAEQDRAEDTYDGAADCDDLDLAQAHPDLDPLDRLRMRIRRADQRQRRRARRRIRRRSGVTTNVHIDLKTLSRTRAIDDFDGLVLRGDKWGIARSAAEQLLCDSAMVATLFAGRNEVLDANTAAEQFSHSQRRAIVARDGGCVFPDCDADPRHCDIHHLHERNAGGPTTVANGVCACRFHHRLIHECGWTLVLDADGRWMAIDPHGTEWRGRRRTTDQSAA